MSELLTAPSLWLWHLLLLAIVVYTDVTRRKIYLPWSAVAVATGTLTALRSPAPEFWLFCGAVMFILGYAGLAKRQVAGGDVWFLTYLGLLFGPVTILALLLGSLTVVLAVAMNRLQWGGTMPLAAVWGVAGLVVWLLLGPSPYAAPVKVAQPAPTPAAPISPLPTPTVDAEAAQIAEEAAAAVALVGLVGPRERPDRAQAAAESLRELARGASRSEQQAFLHCWASALERYADGDARALPLVQQLSEANQSYLSGGSN